MEQIEIQDNLITWRFEFNPIYITAEYGEKKLSMYWSDDFGIIIDDTSDDSLLTDENVKVDFLIPHNSVLYSLCQKNIPDNYIIFADDKPAESKKHVSFSFTNEGMIIEIDSDYKSDDAFISTSLIFWGLNGGSNQEPGYKDNFIEFLRELLEAARTLGNTSDVKRKLYQDKL